MVLSLASYLSTVWLTGTRQVLIWIKPRDWFLQSASWTFGEARGKQEGKEKEIYTERYFGTIYRSFSLPYDLDSAKAEAAYDKGVLTLTLPKKADGNGTKKITVS